MMATKYQDYLAAQVLNEGNVVGLLGVELLHELADITTDQLQVSQPRTEAT